MVAEEREEWAPISRRRGRASLLAPALHFSSLVMSDLFKRNAPAPAGWLPLFEMLSDVNL
jgi:hypothetical protein